MTTILEFPEKPDALDELEKELNTLDAERFLEKMEELINEDDTGHLVTFIELVLKGFCSKAVATGEPFKDTWPSLAPCNEEYVDCAHRVLRKFAPSRKPDPA